MKFMVFCIFDAAKAADMSQLSDKFNANPPKGWKHIAMYTCQSNPFPQGLPENVSPTSMVSISIQEVESNDALSASMYPFILAGAVMWAVPVLELNIGKVTAQDKKLRG